MSNNDQRKNGWDQEYVVMVNVKMVWINALIKLVNNKETFAINQAKYNVMIVIIIIIIVIIIVTIIIILMINSLQWYAPSQSTEYL